MDQQQLCEWAAVEACLECITSVPSKMENASQAASRRNLERLTSPGKAVSAFEALKWLRSISLLMLLPLDFWSWMLVEIDELPG